jgi:hypothetical protein
MDPSIGESDAIVISLAYACETIDILSAEAYIAEHIYFQKMIAAKPYHIAMVKARECLKLAFEDLESFALSLPPDRVGAIVTRLHGRNQRDARLRGASNLSPHVTAQQTSSSGTIHLTPITFQR